MSYFRSGAESLDQQYSEFCRAITPRRALLISWQLPGPWALHFVWIPRWMFAISRESKPNGRQKNSSPWFREFLDLRAKRWTKRLSSRWSSKRRMSCLLARSESFGAKCESLGNLAG
jgi:hypothetical protein